MGLILTVVSSHNEFLGQGGKRVVDGDTFTIGRATNNDWQLPDPLNVLSRKHCLITHENGRYLLQDTSVNGVFVNDSAVAVGKDNQIELTNGDKITVGDYCLLVDIGAPADSHAIDQSIGSMQPDPIGTVEPTPDSVPESGDPIGIDETPAPGWKEPAASDHLPEQHEYIQAPKAIPDPAQAASKPNHDNTAPDSGAGANPPIGNLDDDSLIREIIRPPASDAKEKTDASGENDDSRFTRYLEGIGEPEGMAPIDTEGTEADGISTDPAEQPNKEPGTAEESTSDQRETIAEPPGVKTPLPDSHCNDPLTAAPPDPGKVTHPMPIEGHTDMVPAAELPDTPPVPPEDIDGALQALLIGAGLADMQIDPARTNELMHNIGVMLRQAVLGISEVLHARQKIRNEFRIERTMVGPVDNNPFKVLPADEILKIMFGPKTQAWMSPIKAFHESLHDIKVHELAVIAGMQAAVRELFEQLDPEVFEEHANQVNSGWFGPNKSKYWDAYKQQFAKRSDAVDDEFQKLFERAFSEAYEAQQRRGRLRHD